MLFYEEALDAQLGRWQWQNPLVCAMVSGFVIVNFTRAGPGFEAVRTALRPVVAALAALEPPASALAAE